MPGLVTAIVPVFNHRKWVNEAIDSILVQDYPIATIIVIDDGSTDNSCEVVEKRLYKPQLITHNIPEACKFVGGKIIHSDIPILLVQLSKNCGPSFSRNIGIKIAWQNTDHFLFLDSDDIYESNKVSRSVEIVSEFPDYIGVVFSDYTTFNPTTGVEQRQYKEPFSRLRLQQECIINCDSLISKKAFEKCGLFDESMRVCEDFDLWQRISRHFVCCHIPESLVKIRVGGHSSTDSVNKKIWEECYNKVMKGFMKN